MRLAPRGKQRRSWGRVSSVPRRALMAPKLWFVMASGARRLAARGDLHLGTRRLAADAHDVSQHAKFGVSAGILLFLLRQLYASSRSAANLSCFETAPDSAPRARRSRGRIQRQVYAGGCWIGRSLAASVATLLLPPRGGTSDPPTATGADPTRIATDRIRAEPAVHRSAASALASLLLGVRSAEGEQATVVSGALVIVGCVAQKELREICGFQAAGKRQQSPPGPRQVQRPLPLVCWPERPRLHIVSATCWGFRLATSRKLFRALAQKSQHAQRSSRGLCTFQLHTPSTAILCPALPQASLVGMFAPSAAASASRCARRLPRWRRCPFLSSGRRGRLRVAMPATTGAPSTLRSSQAALPLWPFTLADARSSATSALACTRSAHLYRHQLGPPRHRPRRLLLAAITTTAPAPSLSPRRRRLTA
ncbi:hypothetical protein PSPO01_11284 [Paraphaeosphaeria sporulosa]